MNIDVEIDISPSEILNKMGLGGNNKAQIFLASEVKRLCDPYVPFQNGELKRDAVIAPDGSTLTYNAPYAHYQYYGEVMAGRAPKHYTGKPLNYNGAPMRGANWDKRMMADKSDELAQNLGKYIGG